MKKRIHYSKTICWIFICTFILAGCSGSYNMQEKSSMEKEQLVVKDKKIKENETKMNSEASETDTEHSTKSTIMKPEIIEADWSEYFDALNGAAVIYDSSNSFDD